MQARKAINRYAACVAVGLAAFCALSADRPDGGCPVSMNLRGHENTEWSQSYAYHLVDGRKNLPRVLLVGDSIVNGYQGEARRLLEAKGVNVTYWISSYCVTSPHYLTFLGIYLDEAKYDVIHFNNGLHSLDTPTADRHLPRRGEVRRDPLQQRASLARHADGGLGEAVRCGAPAHPREAARGEDRVVHIHAAQGRGEDGEGT